MRAILDLAHTPAPRPRVHPADPMWIIVLGILAEALIVGVILLACIAGGW